MDCITCYTSALARATFSPIGLDATPTLFYSAKQVSNGETQEAGPMKTHPAAWTIPVLGLLSLTVLTACQPGVESTDDAAVSTTPPTVNSEDVGDYVIHFTALPTDQLTAEVARNYGIVRSETRAMLNVSIIKKVEGQLGTAVPGTVEASATNLAGQFKTTTVREIREGDAIYYIAELPVANSETLTFSIEVTPENETKAFPIRFQKQFYASTTN